MAVFCWQAGRSTQTFPDMPIRARPTMYRAFHVYYNFTTTCLLLCLLFTREGGSCSTVRLTALTTRFRLPAGSTVVQHTRVFDFSPVGNWTKGPPFIPWIVPHWAPTPLPSWFLGPFWAFWVCHWFSTTFGCLFWTFTRWQAGSLLRLTELLVGSACLFSRSWVVANQKSPSPKKWVWIFWPGNWKLKSWKRIMRMKRHAQQDKLHWMKPR